MQLENRPILTSLFDLFKIGPGPSSSHTIGPMKAGFDFYRYCLANCPTDVDGELLFEVRLYGSLSATGKGHGTDAAVLAGLLGYDPEHCPPALLRGLNETPDQQHHVQLGAKQAVIGLTQIKFDEIFHNYPYSNTLVCALCDEQGHELFSRTYYSTGGGFILVEGEAEVDRGLPVYPYSNMRQLKEILRSTGLTLHELVLENEIAITGLGRAAILDRLDSLVETMVSSVEQGLALQGSLPGTLGVQRKASSLYEKTSKLPWAGDRFLGHLNAYAFATSEQNADGGLIVTAPTCGASGVMPALLYAMRHDLSIGARAMREGVLAAGAIAFLAKHNAGIAGAEVGCQGEVGVASAMGAAMLAHARGASAQVTENAAEIALEHHLGLTCDPVGGYVQIPCIERNAIGCIKAYNAYLLASLENPQFHQVSLDSVIAAMAETGREMNAKFKETSLGGLAVSMVYC